MNEPEYIKQLEAANSLLQKKLEEANSTIDRVEAVRYKPYWVSVSAPKDTVMFYYQLGNSLIGYVEKNELIGEVRGTTKLSKFTCPNIPECMKLVERDYESYFLRYENETR